MIPEIEQRSKLEIKEYQESKLRDLMVYLADKSNYYKRIFQQNEIDISGVRSLEDLKKITDYDKR